MEENYYSDMRNLDINKISERIFVISEYGKPNGNYYNPSYGDETLTEQDVEPTAADSALTGELDALTAGGTEPAAETTAPAAETTAPAAETTATDLPPMPDIPVEGGTEEDEVEIDVTDIVSGVKKAEDTVEELDDKVEGLGSQVNDYIEKLLKANETLLNKVTDLEKNMNKQFVQRTPTPHEQITLRSMSSYPYTQQLTDYWKQGSEKDMYIANKKLQSDEEESEEDETPKEYNLTYKDINDSFSDADIRKSF
jgi:2-oxoglutarate dehydrogenase complex dehydrogenase (E1) component-like enzyme